MRRVLLGHEDVRMLGRQAVPPLVGRPVRLLGDEEAGDGLLLQPLARITLGDARTFGERRRRQRAIRHERGVQAQFLPDVDAEELERLDGRLEQARGQCLFRADGRTRHGDPSLKHGNGSGGAQGAALSLMGVRNAPHDGRHVHATGCSGE